VVVAAPFNSGLLATATVGATPRYNYGPAPQSVLDRARRLAAACQAEGVELPTAALHFPLRHPAVCAGVVGSATPSAIAQNAQRMSQELPDGFFERLARAGLLP
jgi:D-threo-aldose 1-dehydrogenase